MMEASQSVPDLIATAQDKAKASQDRISEVLSLADGQDLSDEQREALNAATVEIELAAVDIFTAFEARMQRHFKRGPFSRKLKAALLEAGEADLADRVHQHYLAVNVLKHGTGASYRELRDNKSTLFDVKQTSAATADGTQTPVGLIDVTVPGFFDRLTSTLLDAYHFLEKS